MEKDEELEKAALVVALLLYPDEDKVTIDVDEGVSITELLGLAKRLEAFALEELRKTTDHPEEAE